MHQHDDALRNAQAQQPPPVLSDTHSFSVPLKEKPAVVQRDEIIRTRKYRLGKYISSQDDINNFNALCRGETLLVSSSTP